MKYRVLENPTNSFGRLDYCEIIVLPHSSTFFSGRFFKQVFPCFCCSVLLQQTRLNNGTLYLELQSCQNLWKTKVDWWFCPTKLEVVLLGCPIIHFLLVEERAPFYHRLPPNMATNRMITFSAHYLINTVMVNKLNFSNSFVVGNGIKIWKQIKSYIKAPTIYMDTPICGNDSFIPGLNNIDFLIWILMGSWPHLHNYEQSTIFTPSFFRYLQINILLVNVHLILKNLLNISFRRK